jgi:2,4'-dihydroxyacetophenone dioxygenase
MNNAAAVTQSRAMEFLPARIATDSAAPWVPGSAGKSSKPLRFLADNRGFVELMRVEPGVVIPRHRHTGEVHAFNLQGSRQLGSGEIVGPGDYVYEPSGNIDSWKVVGEEPLIVLIVVMGKVEYLGSGNVVTQVITAQTQLEAYRQYCAANAIATLDLVD